MRKGPLLAERPSPGAFERRGYFLAGAVSAGGAAAGAEASAGGGVADAAPAALLASAAASAEVAAEFAAASVLSFLAHAATERAATATPAISALRSNCEVIRGSSSEV